MNKMRLYYSEKQKAIGRNMPLMRSDGTLFYTSDCFGLLNDGRIVEYTEAISGRKGTCNWDDAVFLGWGTWDHNTKEVTSEDK